MKLRPEYAQAMEKIKPFSGHWIRFIHNGARSVAYYVAGYIATDVMYGGNIKIILAPYPKSKHETMMDGLKFLDLRPFIFYPETFTPAFTKYSNDLHTRMDHLKPRRMIEPPSRLRIGLKWLAKAALVPLIWLIAISGAIGAAFLVEALLPGQTGISIEPAQAIHEKGN